MRVKKTSLNANVSIWSRLGSEVYDPKYDHVCWLALPACVNKFMIVFPPERLTEQLIFCCFPVLMFENFQWGSGGNISLLNNSYLQNLLVISVRSKKSPASAFSLVISSHLVDC